MIPFGFQNQSPLPRRLVPNTVAGVSFAGTLARETTGERRSKGAFDVAGVATGFGIMNEEPQIIIGERHGWGDPQPFGISQVDQRQHVYVIGKTGSGKTTLLRNLIVQHIPLVTVSA